MAVFAARMITQSNIVHWDLKEIPLPQACLKYLLRVHLQVRGIDLQKHIKHIMVRPFVLIALLDYLIEQNHEVFRGKGSAEELRRRMRDAVAKEYPETEENTTPEDREGSVPTAVAELLAELDIDKDGSDAGAPAMKRPRHYITEKNATPGDGARCLEECLDNVRPHAICVDKSAAAASDPGTLREGAREGFGELHIQTCGKEIL